MSATYTVAADGGGPVEGITASLPLQTAPRMTGPLGVAFEGADDESPRGKQVDAFGPGTAACEPAHATAAKKQPASDACPAPAHTPDADDQPAPRSAGPVAAARTATRAAASPAAGKLPGDAETPTSPELPRSKPFSAPGECEAAEVLALLAAVDEPGTAGAPRSGVPPPPPAAAAIQAEASVKTGRTSRRPSPSLAGGPEPAAPGTVAPPGKGYSLNSRVGQATVCIVEYICKHQQQYMQTTGSGVPERVLRQAFGNNPDTSKALRFLVLEGRIVRSGLGGRKDPYSYQLAVGGEAAAALGAESAADGMQQAAGGDSSDWLRATAPLQRQGSVAGSAKAASEQQQQGRPGATAAPMRGASKRKPQRAASAALPAPVGEEGVDEVDAASAAVAAAAAGSSAGVEPGSGRRQRRPSAKAQENAAAEELLERLGEGGAGGVGGKQARRRLAAGSAAPSSAATAAAAAAAFGVPDAETSTTQPDDLDGANSRDPGTAKRMRVAGVYGAAAPGGMAAHLSPAPGGMLPGMMMPGAVGGMMPVMSPVMGVGMMPGPVFPAAAGAAVALSPQQQQAQAQALLQMQMQAQTAAHMAFMQMQWMYMQQQQQSQQAVQQQQQQQPHGGMDLQQQQQQLSLAHLQQAQQQAMTPLDAPPLKQEAVEQQHEQQQASQQQQQQQQQHDSQQ